MLAVAHMRQGNTHEAGPGQPGPALPVSLQLRGHRLDLGVGLEGLVAHLAAGPSFPAAISSGKFHGMILPTTPTGSPTVDEWKLAPALAGRPAGTHSGVVGLVGQGAHVFVPSGVHPTAVAAIAAEGAQVTEIAGTYDQAVRLAAEAARGPSAELVQDAGWPGYEQVPGWTVEGYSTLFAEIDAQLAAAGAGGPPPGADPAGGGRPRPAGRTPPRGPPGGAPP